MVSDTDILCSDKAISALRRCTYNVTSITIGWGADFLTFYEIKKIFLFFGKKTRRILKLGKYSDILSASDTEWAYFFPF